jgi:hypothetical protein
MIGLSVSIDNFCDSADKPDDALGIEVSTSHFKMKRGNGIGGEYPGAAFPANKTVFLTNLARSSGLARFKS